jgi:hypothetical protein
MAMERALVGRAHLRGLPAGTAIISGTHVASMRLRKPRRGGASWKSSRCGLSTRPMDGARRWEADLQQRLRRISNSA